MASNNTFQRTDLDATSLFIQNNLCIDENCNLVSNDSKNQVKYPPDMIEGLNLVYVDTTTIQVTSGSCRDDNNQMNIILTENTTHNRPDGTSNDIWVSVFILADTSGTNSPTIRSFESGTVTYPSGYDVSRQIGWYYHTLNEIQEFVIQETGNKMTYHMLESQFVSVQTQHDGAPSYSPWTTLDLSSLMPPSSIQACGYYEFNIKIVGLKTPPTDNFIGFRRGDSSYGTPNGDPIGDPIDEGLDAPVSLYYRTSFDIDRKGPIRLETNIDQEIEYLFSSGNQLNGDVSVLTLYLTHFIDYR